MCPHSATHARSFDPGLAYSKASTGWRHTSAPLGAPCCSHPCEMHATCLPHCCRCMPYSPACGARACAWLSMDVLRCCSYIPHSSTHSARTGAWLPMGISPRPRLVSLGTSTVADVPMVDGASTAIRTEAPTSHPSSDSDARCSFADRAHNASVANAHNVAAHTRRTAPITTPDPTTCFHTNCRLPSTATHPAPCDDAQACGRPAVLLRLCTIHSRSGSHRTARE